MSTTSAAGSSGSISSLIYTGTSASTTAASASGSNQTLGETDFLNLLTTQLKNQNPLDPMDDTQSVSELAQFSALQAQTTLASSFSTFESNFATTQASALLGDSVTVSTTDSSSNSSTVTGTVNAVSIVNGTPTFTMTDSSGNVITNSSGTPLTFTTSQITGISK